MRFDKTFIAIRERSVLEIFDLALHVLKAHFRPLFWLLIIGAAPWIILDVWMIHWMIEDYDYPLLYNWIMILLVVNQAQVGTTFMTHYLGQAMFVGEPSIGSVIKGVFKTSLFFVWIHGAIRMVVPTLLFCLMLMEDSGEDSIIAASAFFMPGCVFIGLLVRAFRPFVSEILLLERTPIRSKASDQIYFGRRSNSLHGAAGSDLFGRFMTASLMAIPLGFSFYALFLIVDNVLNIRANSETSYAPYYFVAALWIVAGYLCVVRFLSYIDVRIRQEGWAVELRMRAEGLRLQEAFE